MFTNFLTSKWTSLACVLINSTFASVSWNQGDYFWAVIAYGFAFLCGYNFMMALKEDYYDKDE